MSPENRDTLIARLAADAAPVIRPVSLLRLSLTWWVAAVLLAGGLILAFGPLREDSISQLGHSPRYALENLLALLATLGFTWLAFSSAVPAALPKPRWTVLPFVFLTAWFGAIAFDIVSPAIEPGMAGKREGCIFDVLLYGLPGLALGLVLVRRLWPLHGVRTGLLIGLAAGVIPALIMQFSCMYLPVHMLTHHLLPGIALGPLGAVAGWLWLRQK